jgi:hypothetical protein
MYVSPKMVHESVEKIGFFARIAFWPAPYRFLHDLERFIRLVEPTQYCKLTFIRVQENFVRTHRIYLVTN